MSIETMMQRLENNRQQVMDIVNTLFDVDPPEPEFTDDPEEVIQRYPTLTHFFADKSRTLFGLYGEQEKIILLNPETIYSRRSELRREGIQINPNWEILRVFAKEYGHHCHSYLQDWSVNDQKRSLIKDVSSGEVKMIEFDETELIPIYGFDEAIGFATKLKVAKSLGHRDEYVRAHEYLAGEIKTLIKEMFTSISYRNDTFNDQLSAMRTIYLGYIIGSNLSRQSDEIFRKIVRLPLKDAYEAIQNYVKSDLNI